MKLLFFIIAAFMTMALSSCGFQWGDGMWIIPTLTGGGALYCWIAVIRSLGSGSRYQPQTGPDSGKWVDVPGKKTVSKGMLFFAVVLTLATIGIIIWQNAEK